MKASRASCSSADGFGSTTRRRATTASVIDGGNTTNPRRSDGASTFENDAT